MILYEVAYTMPDGRFDGHWFKSCDLEKAKKYAQTIGCDERFKGIVVYLIKYETSRQKNLQDIVLGILNWKHWVEWGAIEYILMWKDGLYCDAESIPGKFRDPKWLIDWRNSES